MVKVKGSVLVTLLVVVGVIGGIVAFFLSYANTAVEYEQHINRFDRASQTSLPTHTLKLSELVQVPQMYAEDFKEMIKATFEGRYGADGSKATMQWIQEQNLPFDSSMYRELQIVITAGRDEFKLSQDRKIEICTQYDILTNKPISKMILSVMGYPSLDIQTKCRVVLDTQTIKTFETGIAEPIKLGK